jgi:prevent-host-death family protein
MRQNRHLQEPIAKSALNLATVWYDYFMKYSRDIQSLSVFKRDSAKLLKQMKTTGQPIVLTVNGKAAAVVHDPDSYQEYLRKKDRQEAIEGIKRGRADFAAGRFTEAEDFFREFEARYGIDAD